MVAQDAIEMWIDDGSQALPGDKATKKGEDQKNHLCISKSQQKFKVDPDFQMATVIKIGLLDDLGPIGE